MSGSTTLRARALTAESLRIALDAALTTGELEWVARRRAALVCGVMQRGACATRGWGRRHPDVDAALPDADAPFEVGSLTKVFTATLLGAVGSAGTVRTDDAEGVRAALGMRLPRSCTLQAFATHVSGLPRLPLNALPHVLRNPDDPYAGYREHHLRRDLARLAPWLGLRQRRVRYSNFGYAVLGLALSEWLRMPFASLLEQHVFAPLALGATYLPTAASDAALVPPRDGTGRVLPAWQTGVFTPAGGVRSTVHDLLRFLQAQIDAAPDSTLGRTHRALERIDARQAVGLGWQISVQRDGTPLHWHNGATGGTRAFIAFARERHTAVALLCAGGDNDHAPREGTVNLDEVGLRLLKALA